MALHARTAVPCHLPSKYLLAPQSPPKHYLFWDSSYSHSPRKPLHRHRHRVIIILCLCVSGVPPLIPEYKLASFVLAYLTTLHPLSLGAQETIGERVLKTNCSSQRCHS